MGIVGVLPEILQDGRYLRVKLVKDLNSNMNFELQAILARVAKSRRAVTYRVSLQTLGGPSTSDQGGSRLWCSLPRRQSCVCCMLYVHTKTPFPMSVQAETAWRPHT